ncbi:2-haloacid dehalogenase [Paracoccus halophilus]|uniref:Haloacid dehalogenase n=1 Tax=Paracoccus halophilus TaxID=376733 RepID=A0A099F108_9RHOB|nr:HAD family phosphatase [Paracoccus halophilus]KGJ04375.1 haloacid dehalogenase [Paracoccus halophilus]SFA55018.1 2-haloacid dehalogenase [Paracoccus halophilus]
MKNVIFDLGAVLIEWDPALAFADAFTSREAAEDWMARIGFAAWNREQDAGRSFAEGLAAAHAEHGHEARHLQGYLAAFPLTIDRPVPGSWEILEALLARGVPLYAITNWAAETFPAARELYPRLARVFEDIVVSGEVAMLKPEPGIYRLLMDRNGLQPQDCIFIDDSPANVEGARAVGMEAIHFTGAEALGRELTERGLF